MMLHVQIRLCNLKRKLRSAASLTSGNYGFSTTLVLLFFISLFCAVQHGTKFLPLPESYFEAPISSSQYHRMLTVMRDFQFLMARKKINFMAGAGTLLGSLRHHGPVPWDDDTDVFVFQEDKERIHQALTENLPRNMSNYKIFMGDLAAPAWKFYDTRSPDWYYQHSFRWPYVDIFFLHRINATHVFHDEFGPRPRRLDQLLPLVPRPYAYLMLPSPCNADYTLDFINTSDCQNRAFSHLVGFSMPLWRQYRIPCSRLSDRFEFVSRRVVTLPDGSRVSHENLTVGRRLIHSKTLNIPKCGFSAH